MKILSSKAPRGNTVIGARRNPNITPGGFSASKQSRLSKQVSSGPDGCMDVVRAATKWLDDRRGR